MAPHQLTVLQILPALGAGGAEQSCVAVNAALVKAGHRSIVVSAGGFMLERILQDGGTHMLLPADSKNPLVMMKNATRLARIVRQHKVTHLHARSRAPAWSAYWAAQALHLPFITTFHAAYAAKNYAKKFYNSVMARGDKVIAISRTIAQHIAAAYPDATERLVTIPRGIDLSRFAPAQVTEQRKQALREVWQIPAEATVLLCPARLSPIKGQGVFIAALSLLAQNSQLPPDHVAVLIGDDQGRSDYRRHLQSMIESAGLQAHIKLHDHCPDMPAAYALSRLTIVPSLVPEGFGRVPIEAQAMGVPVIASDLGAMRETVRHGETGWLVPHDDPAALAAAIHSAFHLPPAAHQQMIVTARENVLQHYDVAAMTKKTLEVYEALRASP